MFSLLASLIYLCKEGQVEKGLKISETLDETLVTINIFIDIWLTNVFYFYVSTGEQCIMVRGEGERCNYEAFYSFSIIFLLAGMGLDAWNAYRKVKARKHFADANKEEYDTVTTNTAQEYMRRSITKNEKDLKKDRYKGTLQKFDNLDAQRDDLKQRKDKYMAVQDRDSDDYMVMLTFIFQNFP